jgi:acetolactate synthase-1/2/3 large subunit
MMAQTFNRRMARGAGRMVIDRIPYPVDQALASLAGLKHIVLVGSKIPVAFFAYPDKPSLLAPSDTRFHTLARADEDLLHALGWLADELDARAQAIEPARFSPPAPATGAINSVTIAQSLGALIPENAIVVDEGVSTGRGFFPSTRHAHPHDWLQNMGGSIGIGMPMATGAALACPDRPVLNVQADGSAMYTIQSLWTQAREGLNVTTVLLNNRSYAILRHELTNVGAQNVGRKALDMLDLGRPDLDFVKLARGMGVPGARVDTMEEFNRAVAHGLASEGPYLVEVMLV